MEFKEILYIAVLLTCVWSGTNAVCSIKDRKDCTYTVFCEQYSGSVGNPNCNSNARVTFIIKGSSVDTLTTGFFGSTNFDNKVRSIQAINNKWPNIESYAFKFYTKCIDLNLANNNIKNIKNNAFKTLTVLNSLNLSKNSIEHLNSESFKISDSGTNDLSTLDLSNNLLMSISSEPLSKMSNLKSLYLQNNKINSLADDCFVSMKNLNILNLRNNQLTAINVTLMSLKSLLGLDLAYNHLIKLSGFELNRLGSLLFVNVSGNAIEEVESNCFHQAFSLKSIDFRNNKIKSTIEVNMFINNNQLQYLNLYNNSIEHIEDDAFKHNALITLNIEKNNLKGDITGKTFTGISNLTNLNLSYQSITAIRNDAFSTADSLISLNLSRNALNTIESNSFPSGLNLSVLDISYNNLSDVGFLMESLEGLTELYLHNNQLTTIEQGTFVNQTNLKKLDLSMNFIHKIERFSLPLLTLQYLNVTGNLLEGPLDSNVVSPSKFLRYLDLDNFNFTRLEDGGVVDSPLLARVNLSHNSIEFVGSENFINMDNLYSLDLSYNMLHNLQMNKSNLPHLKSLYLNNNKLQNISYSFANIANIIYLDISNNNFTDINDPIFQTLQNLRVLHVSNNKLTQFNNPQTNSLTKLMTLTVSSNYLSNLNLSYYPDLINVDLSNNNISVINSSFFQDLDYLQSVDLSFNDITKLTPGTFQNLKILKLLNLSSNYISDLRYGSFRGLGRAEVIDVSRNTIHSLDVDIFHECTELKRLILDYNFITQLDFENLVTTAPKLIVLSLGGNPILCKEIVRNYNSAVGGRRVEVTSIDKVFEEDNVHGIWCGTGSFTTFTAATSVAPMAEPKSNDSVSNVLLVWCMVLTILIIVVGVALYLYYRKQKAFEIGQPSHRPCSSIEFDYQSNLLME